MVDHDKLRCREWIRAQTPLLSLVSAAASGSRRVDRDTLSQGRSTTSRKTPCQTKANQTYLVPKPLRSQGGLHAWQNAKANPSSSADMTRSQPTIHPPFTPLLPRPTEKGILLLLLGIRPPSSLNKFLRLRPDGKNWAKRLVR